MSLSLVQYVNRETSKQETERVYGEQELMFLYHNRLGKLIRKYLIRKPWFSHLNAIPKKVWFSRKRIPHFAETFGVDILEAEKPLDQYQSLDEFFSRRLKPTARPLCQDPLALISPADGRVLAYPIDQHAVMQIKQQPVAVAELLQSNEMAAELSGGTAVVVRLAPKDYHRFHFPCDGQLIQAQAQPGPLESVHPIALNGGARSFQNKRVISVLQSITFGTLVMVEIGALTIGTIEQTYSGNQFHRGQEKGYFRFGGSTVVLLWGANGPVIDQDILRNSRNGMETLVKFGTRIATASHLRS
ncbi:phosphatidylserine decarboxylase [Gynuella sunshinyii]|uniref:Phosphatidylserine decarboxylase n=1 Tax=Gynuella sunshinyii YC6258 TaxID=1445510 RepID=A0A0C5VV59_9GAMM|nr:phosphatidylserine decarboxylase [Gynuella sunshinyii]AJQ97183.1 phosphatidylserine decarboxylase [Gynuella sunshinyii YC6258]